MKKYILFAGLFILTSCEQKIDNQNALVKTMQRPLKLTAFNDVNGLVTTLSKNGIGQLKPWSNPFQMGWGSLTDYFPFGSKAKEYGLENNIAYYVEGTQTTVNKIIINLNINNPKERKYALKMLADIATKTLVSLNIETPKDLAQSIKRCKTITFETEVYSLKTKLEKSKIESWQFIIESK